MIALLFIGAVHQAVFSANLRPHPALDNPIFIAIGPAFLAAMAVWIALLLRRFRLPE